MRITTTQAHDCMKNGAMPMPMIFLIMSHLNRNIPLRKRRKLSGRVKCTICIDNDTSWAMIVASAEPLIPHLKTKMKRAASTTFTPTDTSITDIDLRGYPETRSWLFRPR